MAGEQPANPKQGARFHFESPGSVQGFTAEAGPGAALSLENAVGHSSLGSRSLALHYYLPAAEFSVRASTPTFILPHERDMPGYEFLASPTLYSGQQIAANLQASKENTLPISCRVCVGYYDLQDELHEVSSPEIVLMPGEAGRLNWKLSLPAGGTAYRVGLELSSETSAHGTLYLDSLGWSGPAQAVLADPTWSGAMWRRAWVDGVDKIITRPPGTFRLVQNRGRGLVMTGTREWKDYRLTARLTPQLVETCGIAVRVQGMRRYYGLTLNRSGTLRLVRVCGGETLLAEAALSWEFWQATSLSVQVSGQRISGLGRWAALL